MTIAINPKQILDVLTDGADIQLDALLLHNCLGADIAQDVGQLICYMFQHLSTGTPGALTSLGAVTETPINSAIAPAPKTSGQRQAGANVAAQLNEAAMGADTAEVAAPLRIVLSLEV